MEALLMAENNATFGFADVDRIPSLKLDNGRRSNSGFEARQRTSIEVPSRHEDLRSKPPMQSDRN